VTTTAGTGMRQGEVLGLTVDRLDTLRREVRMDRQLVTMVKDTPKFGPVKTDASARTIPLPAVVVAAHLAAHPPWPDGLVLTQENGDPWTRQRFGHVWRPAARAAGLLVGSGGCATTTPAC